VENYVVTTDFDKIILNSFENKIQVSATYSEGINDPIPAAIYWGDHMTQANAI
jgi:hypothetical protein